MFQYISTFYNSQLKRNYNKQKEFGCHSHSAKFQSKITNNLQTI